MRSEATILFLIALLLCVHVSGASAKTIEPWAGTSGQLVLVDDGKSPAPNVIEAEPAPLPTHAIWVGHQPALEALFPDLDFDFAHPEEILIAANLDR